MLNNSLKFCHDPFSRSGVIVFARVGGQEYAILRHLTSVTFKRRSNQKPGGYVVDYHKKHPWYKFQQTNSKRLGDMAYRRLTVDF